MIAGQATPMHRRMTGPRCIGSAARHRAKFRAPYGLYSSAKMPFDGFAQ
jgi:hypothetical protein